jgi:hypothetical protein
MYKQRTSDRLDRRKPAGADRVVVRHIAMESRAQLLENNSTIVEKITISPRVVRKSRSRNQQTVVALIVVVATRKEPIRETSRANIPTDHGCI